MSALGGDYLSRICERVLPQGGWVVTIAEAEVYVDESGSHQGAAALCIAGYVFERDEATRFSVEWSKYLSAKGLPYFHMKECAHNSGVFKHLTKPECIEVETELIRLILDTTIHSFAVVVDETAFNTIITPSIPEMGSAYSFCLRSCLSAVLSWSERNTPIGRVSFFFEAGHRHQGEASLIFQDLYATPAIKKKHSLSGHGFYDKEQALPLQAADLLAWQWHKRMKDGKTRQQRLDFKALLRTKDEVLLYPEQRLAELRDHLLFVRSGGLLGREQIWGRDGRDNDNP